jgi:hydrogenase maturation protein HypF
MQSAMSSELVATRFLLRGHVQGIGIRPAIARLAHQWNLKGFVRNCPAGVEAFTEGEAAAIEAFEAGLRVLLANKGVVSKASFPNTDQPRFDSARFGLPDRFSIEASEMGGGLRTPIPQDINVCESCLKDTESAENRKYQYAFTSCTACGPRYSIIRAMPYDRAATSVSQFALCVECSREYETPDDRRFHAQTNACPSCGPVIWCSDSSGRVVAHEHEAVAVACQAICNGQIVALKGVGGYLLLADATSESAVTRLRARKQRPTKPLAVLVANLAMAESLAQLSAEDRRQLTSPTGPIVLVRARPGNGLPANLHPGLCEIGLMLPATVLHHEIARRCGPLVATSGNLEGDPLEYTVEAAEQRLHNVADLFLHHDRPIERPIDDSVVRVIAGRQVNLRLARGLAPYAFDIPDKWRTERHFVALGGEQKSALAIYNGHQAALCPHIGDLGSVGSRERFVSQLDSLKSLYRVDHPVLVTDLHPGYFTTALAQESQCETDAVQHHHAHLAVAMLEHHWLDREVLGVVWDGTGYGSDATVWGGEFLIGTSNDFQRVAHLRPFRLFGGEAAIREPRRVAISLLNETFGPKRAMQITQRLGWSTEHAQLAAVYQKPRLGVTTTSAGRLFDAVAAIVLGVERADFEGYPAMLLESACDLTSNGFYPVPITDSLPYQLDWRPLVQSICDDLQCEVSPGTIAMRFHRSLAVAIGAICQRFPRLPIALCGGVFQNRILVELVSEELHERRESVGFPGTIPPNDGGLAAGQLAIALSRLCNRCAT